MVRLDSNELENGPAREVEPGPNARGRGMRVMGQAREGQPREGACAARVTRP